MCTFRKLHQKVNFDEMGAHNTAVKSHNTNQFYPVLAFCDTVNIDRKKHIDASGMFECD